MRAATLKTNKQQIDLPHVRFEKHREARENIHPALKRMESAVLTGQAAYSSLLTFRKQGWIPDIVCAHSAFGAGFFAKDVFPSAKYLSYNEWYFNQELTHEGRPVSEDEHDAFIRTRISNSALLIDLAAMDAGITPTQWQKLQFPDVFLPKINVLHDGVDTEFYQPANKTTVNLPGGGVLTNDDDVITYVARGMEPYRGFPQFMQAVAKVQKKNPNAHAIVVGNDRIAYGSKRKDGKTYKEFALKNYDLDLDRTHFTGLVNYDVLRAIFRISSVHVYLTVPFVLSWSMIEAMSTGCIILGSNTPPVQEVVQDEHNGLLVDLFDADMIAERILDTLKNNTKLSNIRKNARETVLQRYDAKNLLPCHRQMLVDLA
ncbi:glycosyltransferase [Labrenzia sp. CE80]|uniref:glycosyltransferase n=1 Tax=Labrenzia sp. CE80 TaxID=1788986 RepID=UPI001389F311|nr:glycosyltransferase [Labrenzia sp. CE80]